MRPGIKGGIFRTSYDITQNGWLVQVFFIFFASHCWLNTASHKISLSLSIIKTQVPTYYMVIGTLFYMYIIVLCNNTGLISLEIKLTHVNCFKAYLCLARLRVSGEDITMTTPPTL